MEEDSVVAGDAAPGEATAEDAMSDCSSSSFCCKISCGSSPGETVIQSSQSWRDRKFLWRVAGQ